MFTADERRALLFLAAVAAAGGLMRVVRAADGGPPGGPLIAPELRGEDLARQAALSRRAEELARPLRPGETIDLDRAGAEAIERLPRIGPELARRIAAYREAHGPFGSLEGLDRVPGVGPAMLEAVRPWVGFSSGAGRRAEPGARPPDVPADPGRTAGGARGCPSGPIRINIASASELQCLPGVGPALAGRIAAGRPYQQVEDLERVPGIGPARVRQLTLRVAVP